MEWTPFHNYVQMIEVVLYCCCHNILSTLSDGVCPININYDSAVLVLAWQFLVFIHDLYN